MGLLVSAVALTNCQSTAPLAMHAPLGATALQRISEDTPEPRSDLPAAPPMTLTASDGTGLTLVQLTARAVVEDPLAFTELHLIFENPRDRVIEGNFSITLPPGATVSRFAMKLQDIWQEGEVVEKQAARRAYEDFLHRKQDPALLEQGAGNEFTARVFPIPANGRKELVLSYSQEMGARAGYALPLRGLPEVGNIDVAVTLPGAEGPVQTLKEAKFVPHADFVLDAKYIKRSSGLRSGNLVLARVHPLPESHPDPITSAIVLFDTSGSRALGFEDQISLLRKLVQKLAADAGPKALLLVACFDQATEPIFSGEISAFGDKEIAKIRERDAFGASNLEQALAWAQERARVQGTKRVIVMTDGVTTAGEGEADKLSSAALKLKTAGVERLDAIAVGGIRDEAILRRLVTVGLARDGVVADGALAVNAIVLKLNEATRSGLAVKVEGASWSYPTKLDGVQAGDEVLVYADVPASQPVKISVAGTPVSLELDPIERPLLERAWVQAKIASLVARESVEGRKPETQKEIVGLSVAYRVMSPYTALLVLETEADYARFKIERSALSDVLTVENGRLALLKRNAFPDFKRLDGATKAQRAQRPRSDDGASENANGNAWGDAIGDSFGAGGLGLSGVGEGGGGASEGIGLGSIGTVGHGSGFGNGHGRLGGSRDPRAPMIRQGATRVSGRIPPEVIQRVVRQNFGRFRLCYENALRSNPNLAGRIVVRFTIDKSGSVSKTENGGSDFSDSAFTSCVVRGFSNLSFPQPEDVVTVDFPIIFSPGDGTATSDTIDRTQRPPHPPAPEDPKPANADPYTGKFKSVMDSLARKDSKEALQTASAWHKESPGDVMALVALGEVFESTGDLAHAERTYGSIIDLFSSRADMRRFAGARLERIKDGPALDLAVDTYAKAALQRPDHPEGHRLLAFGLLRKGEFAKAFEAGVAGLKQPYPEERFPGVRRILEEDLGLLGAAWIKSEPARGGEILGKVKAAGGHIEDAPSIRFVLNWETDANDVDFHIYDDKGGHAFFRQKALPSGGDLYADVTTGYGPECFTIRGSKEKRAALYTLQANYYSRGPMGYGMGKLEIIDHDGKGGITFEERPFVAMIDHAFVDLGTVKR
jgi:hypothetical protein